MEQSFKYKARKKYGYETISGLVTITKNFFIFEPENKDFKPEKVAMYRIVQMGFRSVLFLVPNMFYFKTSSGSVSYFYTHKSKIIAKVLENLVY